MKTTITATYKPNVGETIQVTVSANTAAFPDLIAEVKATAIAGVREILTDVLARKDELAD